VKVAYHLPSSKCSLGEKFSYPHRLQRHFEHYQGCYGIRRACCLLAFRGKLLRDSQDKYSSLCVVAWKTAASLGLCAVCWKGSGIAEQGREKKSPKPSWSLFSPHHYTEIVQNMLVWVGGWVAVFSPPQENVFFQPEIIFAICLAFWCWAQKWAVEMLCHLSGKVNILVSLSNFLLSAQVSSLKTKHTFSFQSNSSQNLLTKTCGSAHLWVQSSTQTHILSCKKKWFW